MPPKSAKKPMRKKCIGGNRRYLQMIRLSNELEAELISAHPNMQRAFEISNDIVANYLPAFLQAAPLVQRLSNMHNLIQQAHGRLSAIRIYNMMNTYVHHVLRVVDWVKERYPVLPEQAPAA